MRLGADLHLHLHLLIVSLRRQLHIRQLVLRVLRLYELSKHLARQLSVALGIFLILVAVWEISFHPLITWM